MIIDTMEFNIVQNDWRNNEYYDKELENDEHDEAYDEEYNNCNGTGVDEDDVDGGGCDDIGDCGGNDQANNILNKRRDNESDDGEYDYGECVMTIIESIIMTKRRWK